MLLTNFSTRRPAFSDLLHLREGVEPVGDVGHEAALVGLGHVAHVLRVQQLGDADLAVGDVKGQLHVAAAVRLVQGVVVDQVGPVDVQQRAEGEPVVPAGAEVAHVHLVVARRLALAPQEQALLGRHALLVDVVDGERRISVQMSPRMILRLPSTTSSARCWSSGCRAT